MRRFLLQLSLFAALVAAVDVACGFAFRYLEGHARGGATLRDRFISKELETDVLLYGSSRCVHHYNPQIIGEMLGMSCYNAGQDGSGIILSYGRLLMQNKRKRPKIIICDINPEFDLFAGDNHRFLHWLKSYCREEGVDGIFDAIDPREKYKMWSNMYGYNSRIVEIATDYVRPIIKPKENGFLPIGGEMNRSKVHEDTDHPAPEFDPVKIMYVEKLIDESRGSRLVFVVSPIWYGMDGSCLEPLREICRRRNVELLEFENDPKYVHNDLYFHDGIHLNRRGADEFTRDLVRSMAKDGN